MSANNLNHWNLSNKDSLTIGAFLTLAMFFIMFHVRLRGLIPYLIEEYEERINEPQYTVNENIPLSITISGRKDE